MNRNFRLLSRDVSPCMGCDEKFTACHDRCPKDERGEIGCAAWKAQIERNRKEAAKHRLLQSGKYWKY